MKRKILTLFLITVIVVLCGCIFSDISNVNSLCPTINDHIKKGDEYYNNAASNTNKYYYETALENCKMAVSEFSSAKSSAQKALTYAEDSNDDVLREYVQYSFNEIEAKLNATSELNQAIELFKEKDREAANKHVELANGFMDKAMEYKAKKEQIVKENPSKFKIS